VVSPPDPPPGVGGATGGPGGGTGGGTVDGGGGGMFNTGRVALGQHKVWLRSKVSQTPWASATCIKRAGTQAAHQTKLPERAMALEKEGRTNMMVQRAEKETEREQSKQESKQAEGCRRESKAQGCVVSQQWEKERRWSNCTSLSSRFCSWAVRCWLPKSQGFFLDQDEREKTVSLVTPKRDKPMRCFTVCP